MVTTNWHILQTATTWSILHTRSVDAAAEHYHRRAMEVLNHPLDEAMQHRIPWNQWDHLSSTLPKGNASVAENMYQATLGKVSPHGQP
jgi:hypothetical protein